MNRKVLFAILAGVASVIALNIVVGALVDAKGLHARDHVSSAQGAVPLLPAMALTIWALPGNRRGLPLVALLASIVIVGGAITAVGNLNVVDAMEGESWTDAQAQEFGPSRAGFETGHDLAGTGTRIVEVGAITLALVLAALRAVTWPVAMGSALLSFVWPPHLAPGFGLIVLGVALLIAKNREGRPGPRQTIELS